MLQSQKIPEWMFLQWTSQLLATLDTKKCTIVAPLLYRLARAYPIALQFPFQLSLDLYKNSYDSNKAVVNEYVLILLKVVQKNVCSFWFTVKNINKAKKYISDRIYYSSRLLLCKLNK